ESKDTGIGLLFPLSESLASLSSHFPTSLHLYAKNSKLSFGSPHPMPTHLLHHTPSPFPYQMVQNPSTIERLFFLAKFYKDQEGLGKGRFPNLLRVNET